MSRDGLVQSGNLASDLDQTQYRGLKFCAIEMADFQRSEREKSIPEPCAVASSQSEFQPNSGSLSEGRGHIAKCLFSLASTTWRECSPLLAASLA
jgi:hypothetical protein